MALPFNQCLAELSERDLLVQIATALGAGNSSATNAAAGSLAVVPTASAAQGTFRIVSAAGTTNASSVKASAGSVSRITGYNAAAAARYLKLYDKSSAPAVGTDTPVWTEYLPAQSKFSIDFASAPLAFATGIALALTTGSADSDTGALTAGDILALNAEYQ